MGVSALSVHGQAFEDDEADQELFTAVVDGVNSIQDVGVVVREQNINEEAFAEGLVQAMVKLIEKKKGGTT